MCLNSLTLKTDYQSEPEKHIFSNSLITESPQKPRIIGQFQLGDKLGEGTFGVVRLAIHIQTGEKVAVKILEKQKILEEGDKTRIEREIQILKKLRHNNIIHLYSVIQSHKAIFLIMEYANGKELFEYINKKRRLSEPEACKFYHQIISGIEYLSKVKVAHRDIKPENLLLDSYNEIKIADFGLSNFYPNDGLLSTACGSPCYAAPEMLEGKKYKGHQVDIWSSGIVLFAMLCGFLPFEDCNNDLLYRKIIEGKLHIPLFVSECAKDLLRKILNKNCHERYTFDQIKSHPWFNIVDPKLNMYEGLLINEIIIPIDEDIVKHMERMKFDKEEVIRNLLMNKHNNITTTYYLLVKEKVRFCLPSVSNLKSREFKDYIQNPRNFLTSYNKDFEKVYRERFRLEEMIIKEEEYKNVSIFRFKSFIDNDKKKNFNCFSRLYKRSPFHPFSTLAKEILNRPINHTSSSPLNNKSSQHKSKVEHLVTDVKINDKGSNKKVVTPFKKSMISKTIYMKDKKDNKDNKDKYGNKDNMNNMNNKNKKNIKSYKTATKKKITEYNNNSQDKITKREKNTLKYPSFISKETENSIKHKHYNSFIGNIKGKNVKKDNTQLSTKKDLINKIKNDYNTQNSKKLISDKIKNFNKKIKFHSETVSPLKDDVLLTSKETIKTIKNTQKSSPMKFNPNYKKIPVNQKELINNLLSKLKRKINRNIKHFSYKKRFFDTSLSFERTYDRSHTKSNDHSLSSFVNNNSLNVSTNNTFSNISCHREKKEKELTYIKLKSKNKKFDSIKEEVIRPSKKNYTNSVIYENLLKSSTKINEAYIPIDLRCIIFKDVASLKCDIEKVFKLQKIFYRERNNNKYVCEKRYVKFSIDIIKDKIAEGALNVKAKRIDGNVKVFNGILEQFISKIIPF